MTVGKLIAMLEEHNRSAEIKFSVGGNFEVAIASDFPCKCQETEIKFILGNKKKGSVK